MKTALQTNAKDVVAELDNALLEFSVERQPFFGKAFVGNHIGMMLKVNSFVLYGFSLSKHYCHPIMLMQVSKIVELHSITLLQKCFCYLV